MNTILCCFDWNALTAIGTLLLAIVTVVTVCQNRYQLSELKRQREEDTRARIDCSIIEWHNCYFFKIQNVGRSLAYNIQLKFEGNPIVTNPYRSLTKLLVELQNKKLMLSPGANIYFLLIPKEQSQLEWTNIDKKEWQSTESITEWINKNENEKIVLTGTYNDKYSIDIKMSIREFLANGSVNVMEPLAEIAESLSSNGEDEQTIQKSLYRISLNQNQSSKNNPS